MQKVVSYFILSCCVLFVSIASRAQSVLNPADTITEYNPLTLPAQPTYGQIGKWVRTKSMNWDATEYKAYIYKGCAFRLHYPKSYNPTAADGKKYPLIIMFHGKGEAGPITDNETQLTHGAQLTQIATDTGSFDGYAFFMQSQGLWGGSEYQYISEIIDYMAANNKVDRFRVYVHGLSAGGQGTWEMLFAYPTYISCILPMSWTSIGYKDTSIINAVKFTPIWNFQGGVDGSPAASTSEQVAAAMVAAGGNYTYTEYPNLGHDTWDSAYANPNFFPFMLNTYMSNPWPLYGRTAFCPGDTINVTIGLARGFDGYQWRKDSTVITGDTTNTIIATLPGKYDARVKKGTTWSDWSHTPVNIIIKSATITPPIIVAGAMSDVIPAADGNNYVNLQLPNNGYIGYSWVKAGSSTVIDTLGIYKATQPGKYQVYAHEKYGCSSVISPVFTVVNANGTNPPSAATNLVARALSFTQVELDWARNPKPTYSETAFEIYRGTTSGGPYTYVGQAPADTVTYIDHNLTPNVKYYYKIRAIDTTAAAPLSNEANATTQSDKTPPTAPDSLTIAGTDRNAITLTWHPSTDNVGVHAYDIYVNGTKSYTTTNTTFIVSGLRSFQQYSFYVKARDISGNVSQPSNQACGATILQGLHYKYYEFSWTSVPNFNSYTPVKQGYSTNVDLSVKNRSTQFGFLWEGYIIVPVTGTYKFETNSDDGSKLWIGQYTPATTPLVNNDGVHGPTYAGGTITLKAGVYPISIAYFQQLVSSSITLYWTCKSLYGDTLRHQITNQYFNDTYTPAGTAPAMPTNVSAVATAYNKVSLSWTDNSTNETGFEIYRATNPGGEFTIVNAVPANTTSFVDSTVAAFTTYYYRIQAVNNYGGSGYDPLSAGQLHYTYYEGTGWTVTPNFDTLTPIKSGFINNVTPTILTALRNRVINFAFKFVGVINIPTTGTYTFLANSYDGSMIYINGLSSSNLVVNNDGKHGGIQKSGTITLAKGSYPIYVTYFTTSITSLILTYKGPGIATQVIPDSAFINKQSSTTTFALPPVPAVPTGFITTALSPSVNSLSWSSVAGATSYQIYRSIGDTTKFKYLATLPTTAISYNDSSLFGNVNYYYKINCTGVGGTSAFSITDSARTKDNRPVIVKTPPRLNAQYNTTTTIPFSATDADGDSLTFTIQNMPAFGSFTNNGNQTATLTLNPDSTKAGYYNNVKVVVSDNNGGFDSTAFNLVVNNHINPTLDSIPNYILNENDTLSIPLIAFETNSSDSISWTITNLPNNNTITPVSNGINTLFLHPTYAAAGIYNVQVSINDTDGGYATRQFIVTVNYKNPNTYVYARFQDLDPISTPWNNITGTTSTNFKDANGNTTPIGFSLPSSWYATWHEGPTTGNNSGVYPDAVLKDYFYFGIFGGPNSITAKLTGLDTSKYYNITLYAGSAWSGAANNGSTSFTMNSQTDTLNVQNNTQNTVTFSSVKPAADSTISFTMAKVGTAPVGYLNAIVITSLYDDGTTPIAPTSLTAQNTHGVQLSWNDLAYNALGYQVYRSSSATGTFSIIGTTSPTATSFNDSTVSGNVEYYYEVNAFNTHGNSAYSNLDSIVTTDRVPSISPISTVVVKNNQQATVNIIAVDDSTDHITLTATGLPSFATLVDSGDGKGTIVITPTLSSVGYYSGITVTATDLSDSSRSTTFNISVVDKDVTSVYLDFSDGSAVPGAPWNSLAGWPFAGTSFTNLLDDGNNTSGITVTLDNGFQGVVASGMRPRNGQNVYPEAVMRPGEFEGTTTTDTIKISGLANNKKYNFVFFNSHDDGLNGSTNFAIQGQTVSSNASYNINKTVQINGIKADASGNVYIAVSKGTNADYAFITSLIIQSYDSSLSLLSPTDLRVIETKRNFVSLQWQDRASSEAGFEIWRANDSTNTYSLLTTTAANVTSYKDSNVSPNRTYYYIVRAFKDTATHSNYSNAVAANTLAYAVYINYTSVDNAPVPWNNLDLVPLPNAIWNNFSDDQNVPTSVGMTLTNTWAGLYGAGMNTGNNSGVYPDSVLMDAYGLFPGQIGTFTVSGLDLAMRYNLTFMASSQAFGDVNTAFIVNSNSTDLSVAPLLNASLNTKGLLTLYNIAPDSNGNINIAVMPGTLASQFGLINALVVQGYNPSTSGAIPAPPASKSKSTYKSPLASSELTINNDATVSAYPNPFTKYFTLSIFNNEKQNEKVKLMIYDITGRLVYKNEYDNIGIGTNMIRIDANHELSTQGLYIVKLLFSNTQNTSTIKLIKE